MRVIGWTFPTLVRGDPRGGGPATLTVEWRFSEGLSPEEQKTRADQAACVGTWWCGLVESGGGGGDTIPPPDCAATLTSPDPERLPNRLTWQLDRLRIDPRALTILLNLFLMTQLEITGVTLKCAGADLEQNITPRDQLPVWTHVPFPLRLELAERDICVELELGQDISAQARPEVEQMLQTWALVGSLGGFRNALPADQRSELLPTDDIGFEFDLVIISLRDYDAHPVAYDVLVNIAVKLATTKIPVRSLEIA